MVCCALVAGVLASGFWLIGLLGRVRKHAGHNALAWRLADGPAGDVVYPSNPFSLRARIKSVRHAADGLRLLVRTEHNARIHLAATVLAVAAGVALGISTADWRWIVAAIVWVWAAEALNTAIEHLCDAVCPTSHPAIRAAKDVAAGGVLAVAIGAATIGAITLAPYVTALLVGDRTELAICRAIPW